MSKDRLSLMAHLVIPIAVGIFLRVYMLGDQIILDDEWHGIGVARWKSYGDILTTFWFGASSIPYDLYLKFALNTVGWNEWLIRLPSIATGVLSLLVFPAIVNKVFDKKVTAVFSLLLTVSPFLIFYSRFARGYGAMTFFAFIAVFSFYFWLTTGMRFYWLCYIITAPLAMYFHLFSAFAVIPPVFAAISIKLSESIAVKKKTEIVPSLSGLVATVCAVISCIAALLLPAYINSAATYKLHLGTGYFLWPRFAGFLHLFSGTPSRALTILFYLFFVAGFFILAKREKLFGIIVLSMLCSYVVAFSVLRPDAMQVSKIMARYSLAILPFAFISVSVAIVELINSIAALLKKPAHDFLFYSFSYIFIGLLLITGPLPSIYTFPNNFTNHSAYQDSYNHKNDKNPYKLLSETYPISGMSGKAVPLFYKQMGDEKDDYRIIEYPTPINDRWNFQYYYQKFHRKRVVAGYFWNPYLSLKDNEEYSDRISTQKTYLYHPGFFLKASGDNEKLKFKNMINMKNIDAINKSDAKYVIIHKNFAAEVLGDESFGTPDADDIVYLSIFYSKYLGRPIIDDKWLTVFENTGFSELMNKR